jgi:hypothetical protein
MYAVVGLIALSCRLGYETLPEASGGGGGAEPSGGVGASASGSAGTPSGGTETTGGAANGAAGEPSAGAPPTGGASGSAGAPPTIGGDDSGGAPGIAGTPGDGGSPSGGAPNGGECQTTVDCTCATFEAKSYWFCATAAMVDAASQQCGTQGMTLVRIDSQGENDFIQSTASTLGMLPASGFVQIGANDIATDGEWRWRDGTPFWQGDANGAAVGGLYANWLDSSPTNSGIKNCSGMTETGEWQDRSCTAVSPYVCESP